MSGLISASSVAAAASVASAAAAVGGTVAKAGGQLKGGQATSQADYYRAQVARNNADAYDAAATRTVQGGEVASDTMGLRAAQNLGKVKASQAANGIDVNTGSAVDVQAGTAQAGRLDQLTTLSNAQLQGYGYRTRAAQERAQANLDSAGAAQAPEGAAAEAASTILGGASALPFGLLQGDSSGGDFTGTVAGSTAYGSPADTPSSTYGGPR